MQDYKDYFREIAAKKAGAEELAVALLAEVRLKLIEAFPELDKVGADATMLAALAFRAGKHRYYWPTLQWIIETAYGKGHLPYANPVALRGLDNGEREDWLVPTGYNPFSTVHHHIPEGDADYYEDQDAPLPDYQRPLRFLQGDVYKWERELGTSVEETHRLYRGEDIDDESGPA